jgi:glycosyltransferase involved in cell wall biosynthesis
MSCEMQLSLVICTRNRALQLAECLRSLTRLQYSVPWELVIVDNGSKDETQDVINSYTESLPLKTVIEPKAGLGRARNRGWATSTGNIVAFTDDDCYPAEDFLGSIVLCFEQDSRIGFIGGRVLLHDPEDYRSTVQEQAYRQELRPGEFLRAGLIHGANFACRRMALESVGGFDERFGAGALFGSAEDVDIQARMLAWGWLGAYDPRPLVYHHHGRTEVEVLKLRKGYDRGRGAYYSKCILNPKLHTAYLRNWCWAMRRQPWERTARELAAGAEFLVRSAAARLYSARGTQRQPNSSIGS